MEDIMKLNFDETTVRLLMAHARDATDHKLAYGQTVKAPGLWLVGDEGIYLMSNGSPGLIDPQGKTAESNLVAYARECNPKTMDFDAWWSAKQRSWGGDDGVEFLALKDIPASGRIAIEMANEMFSIFELV
jgi:hypothetical protein